ncbi:NADP-dependent oxidoreductase [Actinocrispum sp. NPDC049592]|uniref:NADP-dependent oxidoreductase n=1 Tax=Actinocrispum sp. NPDC049592 TaxID=3154835 RepID=UPI003418F306
MKAARIRSFGSAISFDDLPIPVPAPGEVLLEVAATSFNPTEVALRSGVLATLFPIALPFTLGWDVAGTVVALGPDVDRFALGDRVIGVLDGGAAAAYVAAPASRLVHAPVTVPLAHAAAIPLAGLTAWQTVFEHAKVVAGQRVLVNGAGGGVGGYAVQLAKHAGAHVIATASPRSHQAVLAQGADDIIDYTRTPVTEALTEPVDTILNITGFPATVDIVPWVRPGGTIISVSVPVTLPSTVDIHAAHMVMRNDPNDLRHLVDLIDTGAVTDDITETHPLTALPHIHHRAETGDIRGKIILHP